MTITPPLGTRAVGGLTEPVIDLERVTKVYRTGSISVAALRGVSLSIARSLRSPRGTPA